MRARTGQPDSRLGGALVAWFGTLGGAVAWILHLFSAWSVTETTCLSGHHTVGSLSLGSFVAVATTVPLLTCLLAVAAAWWVWRQTDPRHVDESRQNAGRVHLLAGVGMAANILFSAIVVFDGIALLVMPVCQL